MSKVDSIGDGYTCNWPCTCDACHAAACTLYCHTDSAYLCIGCDQCIHAAIPPALPDHRVWICTECEKAPADFTCKADAASLCINCDFEIHSANPIACCHNRVPVSPLTGLVYAASSNTYHCELPAPMFDVGNEIVADEAEADYFLLLDLDSTEDQPNSEFMYSGAVDEYLEPVEYDSSTKFQYQDEYQQQQPYGTNQGENISDIILPVQSVDARKIRHNISFTGEFEASKAAFINTPSSSHSVRFYIPYATKSNFFKVAPMRKLHNCLLDNLLNFVLCNIYLCQFPFFTKPI